MNAIVRASMERHHPMSIGYYDAGALQRAMRNVLERKHDQPRERGCKAKHTHTCFDVRPDGRRVEL
jgi:hypothetical protein